MIVNADCGLHLDRSLSSLVENCRFSVVCILFKAKLRIPRLDANIFGVNGSLTALCLGDEKFWGAVFYFSVFFCLAENLRKCNSPFVKVVEVFGEPINFEDDHELASANISK